MLRISERRARLRVSKLRLVNPAPVRADLVEALEWLLAAAKKGEVVGVCAALVHMDGSCSGIKTGTLRIAQMLWALERIRLRLMGFVEEA